MQEKEVTINEFRIEEIEASSSWIIVGNPGMGKCFGRNTLILMYDGKTKKVENIEIGDDVMGDDFTPRKVTKLFQGKDKLYKITPQDSTDPYFVTGNHTLCLRYNTRPSVRLEEGRFPRYRVKYCDKSINNSNGYPLSKVKEKQLSFSCIKYTEEGAKKIADEECEKLMKEYNEEFPLHEVEVKDFLKQTKSFNHRLVAFRTGVEFSGYEDQEIDPYLLGAWLGDGTSACTEITNIDPELISYLYSEAKSMGLKIKRGHDTENSKGSMRYYFSAIIQGKGKNMFLNFLKKHDLINNKHIPHNYKVNSRKSRLSLLAGLIDTDGYYAGGGGKFKKQNSYYEITQKNKKLAKDIVFVARSLGFWCHAKEVDKGCMYKGQKKMGKYQRITFGGYGLNEIPILIPRKKAFIRNIRFLKDPLHYKIAITEDEEDDYFGFEVEGANHRFLLGDFTVTHNCLAPKTPIIMFDKTIKYVEDIKIGEKLMGDDAKSRNVLSICSGEDEMYKIKQSNGNDYVVNKPHILVLKNDENKIIEKSVSDILDSPPSLLEEFSGYRLDPFTFKISSLSKITIEFLGKGRYHGFQIDGNGRFLLGDYTVTHNTTLIENLCYYNRQKYAVGRAFIGTESGYKKFCDILGPLYVSNRYDEAEERRYIYRQKMCEIENGKQYPGNGAINILDDVSDDPTIFRTNTMKGIFKLGSRHWNQLFMVGLQYAIDMPPDIRKSASYIALFREPEEIERKKLYNNFGGLAKTYKNFCDLMDQLTGDFTCLIFNKRSQSNELEDCVFYYKTVQLPPWKFGCKEAKDWDASRRDKNKADSITI